MRSSVLQVEVSVRKMTAEESALRSVLCHGGQTSASVNADWGSELLVGKVKRALALTAPDELKFVLPGQVHLSFNFCC